VTWWEVGAGIGVIVPASSERAIESSDESWGAC